MPGLKVFVSNRLETLASELAAVLSSPLASPLTKEIVVVQSTGMQRWVSMKLAALNGICTHTSFPFPNAVLRDLFTRVMPSTVQDESFDVEYMTWRLMDLIPKHLGDPGFSGIQGYLENDPDGLKLFQLSRVLADTFDQYMIFRPDLILDWEKGRASHVPDHAQEEYWQSCLWRDLARHTTGFHRARLRMAFLQALDSCDPGKLPERISVFGISYLPRFHLDIFGALSHVTHVYLFLMNPCSEFWSHIRSRNQISRMKRSTGHQVGNDLHLEQGNPLLAALGSLGRDFFDIILEQDFEGCEWYSPTGLDTMLGCVQDDILELKDPHDTGKREVRDTDRSIQVHSCHSPMREVEVLFDSLLSLFEETPDLRPEEILVMAPDIETYAPLVHAVFDLPRSDQCFIPFSIADRSFRRLNEITDTFLSLLELPGSRYEASRVFSILEAGSVRKKFSLDEEDLALIQTWISDANIRWGRRNQSGDDSTSPGPEQNTWEWGIRRLLLGYAMPTSRTGLFEEILPSGDIQGEDSLVLGHFLDYVQTLFSFTSSMKHARPLKDWSRTLMDMVDAFFAEDEAPHETLHTLRASLGNLARAQDISCFSDILSLEVIRSCLKDCLERSREGTGFISRGVTFCSMLPMRSIPFRVIWLLGMNHSSYPRQARRTGFDLISAFPNRGDRSKRDDDLYIFLEAMLSARDVFCMSYTGQGLHDNASIPPSVVVSTLVEYLESSFQVHEGKGIQDRVVKRHPLQAFNPRYFTGEQGLFSYSTENARAAMSIIRAGREPRDFGVHALREPGPGWKILDIESLSAFFRNPAQYLLRNRLGLTVIEGTRTLLDREPFEIDSLQAYQLRSILIEDELNGIDHEETRKRLMAEGVLPHGPMGESDLDELSQDIQSQARTIRKLTYGLKPHYADIEFTWGDFLVKGPIALQGERTIVAYRPGLLSGNDLVRIWIAHLLVCAASEDSQAQSHHVARDTLVSFDSVPNARGIIGDLLAIYWSGLCRPSHFFPQSSWKFSSSPKTGDRTQEDRLKAARAAWEGSYALRPESDDIYYRICFGGVDPLDDEFMMNSENVFGPLLEHARLEKL
ncbi:MAG: exodeoxyribonuclease V subunit gamma [Desulfomonilia bacterium]